MLIIDESLTDDPALANGAWAELAATVAVTPDLLPNTLRAGGAVFVRPDRYVAAVALSTAEIQAASEALLHLVSPA